MISKQESLIKNKIFSAIIIQVILGNKYPQIIAKELNKSPTTIVRQIAKLKDNKLLVSTKEKRLNKTLYYIKWDTLSKLFSRSQFKGDKDKQKVINSLFTQGSLHSIFLAFVKDYWNDNSEQGDLTLEDIFEKFTRDLPESKVKRSLHKIRHIPFRENLEKFIGYCEEITGNEVRIPELDKVMDELT